MMRDHFKTVVTVVSAPLLLMSCQSAGDRHLASTPPLHSCDTAASRAMVRATVFAFFAALSTDDFSALEQVTTPTFYAYDVGKRYSMQELSDVIRKAHQSGRVIKWSVGPIDSRIDCSFATATWENTGSAGTAQKLEPRSWLESAVLVRVGDRWLIDFLHSTPKDPRP